MSPSGPQRFNIASDYDEREQERRDIEEAANVSLDMSHEAYLLTQEYNTRMNEAALQSIHQGHPIHSLLQSPSPEQQRLLVLDMARNSPSSVTSSFLRELEAQIQQSPPRALQFETPPRRQQQQQLALPPAPPMPGFGGRPGSSSDGVNVPVPASPITVLSSPGVSPIPVVSSPSPKQRARLSSRRGTRIETDAPETGLPRGKSVQAKPKGRPAGSKNKPK